MSVMTQHVLRRYCLYNPYPKETQRSQNQQIRTNLRPMRRYLPLQEASQKSDQTLGVPDCSVITAGDQAERAEGSCQR